MTRRLRIAFPETTPSVLPWAPAPGAYIALSSNTMRDVAGADPSNGRQPLISVLDNWNSSVYARDAGTYGMIINSGSGHGNFHDAFYGQSLALAEADSTWARLYELSTYPSAFSENGGAGDILTGAVPPGLYNRPTPPHTYDSSVYIPASAYGNTKGAFCYPVLQAVGNPQPISRYYAWFLDLDTMVWTISTNAVPVAARGSFKVGGSGVYDPVNNCIWWLDTGFPSHVGKLDVATKTWTSVAHSTAALNTAQYLIGGYCVLHGVVVWYWQGGNRIIIWNPATNVMTWNATQTGTAPSGFIGLEWCPHAGVQKFYGMEFVPGAFYPVPTAKTLAPPASLGGIWTWGSETFAAQGGAGAIGNQSASPRYNALRWVDPAVSFCWANRIDGATEFMRPALAA